MLLEVNALFAYVCVCGGIVLSNSRAVCGSSGLWVRCIYLHLPRPLWPVPYQPCAGPWLLSCVIYRPYAVLFGHPWRSGFRTKVSDTTITETTTNQLLNYLVCSLGFTQLGKSIRNISPRSSPRGSFEFLASGVVS